MLAGRMHTARRNDVGILPFYVEAIAELAGAALHGIGTDLEIQMVAATACRPRCRRQGTVTLLQCRQGGVTVTTVSVVNVQNQQAADAAGRDANVCVWHG